MKSVVATITLVLVAAASVAHATAMVEVPNPPPYLPPPAPTPEQQRRDRGKVILVGGLVLLGVGTGLTGGAIGFAEDHRCFLPLSCLFGPATNDPLVFEALALSALFGVGGGIALTVVGATLARPRRNSVSLRWSGNSVSLSGRF